MIYLDSSTLMELPFEEPESEALSRQLMERADLPKLASRATAVEVVRVSRRMDAGREPAARIPPAGLDLAPLSATVVDLATTVDGPSPSSLAVVQLATSLVVEEALVAYDYRLLEAARAQGLLAITPA